MYEDILVALGPAFKVTHEHDFYPAQNLQCSEIDYDPDQVSLLEQYKQIGVVVDTVIFRSDHHLRPVRDVESGCIVEGMQVFADRYLLDFQKHHPGKNIADYFSIQIDPDTEPSGTLITFEEFLGPGFDIAADRLRLFSYNPESRILLHPVHEGFVKALLEPPQLIGYPGNPADPEYLHRLTKNLTQILRDYLPVSFTWKICRETDHLVIYQWSDDWSNYFESGQEWWGVFSGPCTIPNGKQLW